MMIAVLADEVLKNEWSYKEATAGVKITWVDSVRSLTIMEADAYFDLLFEMDTERLNKFKPIANKPVFVNAVAHSTRSLAGNFIRINAWPTMLRRGVTEIAVGKPEQEAVVKKIFDQLTWKYQLVPDVPGMITARVIAMIINEAYYVQGEKLSSKEEVDIAMKLGTNYPMGPFEWSDKIGLPRIYELLSELKRLNSRYAIAPALEKEVRSQESGVGSQ